MLRSYYHELHDPKLGLFSGQAYEILNAKKEFFEVSKGMSSKDFFSLSKNEHVKCVQHWMGTGDFFFCHWIAESEDAILDHLIDGGEDQFFHTMCAEMDYYITPTDGNNDIYAKISYVD